MNYRVTVNNYKEDKYYSKVVRAVNEILNTKKTVRSTDIFKLTGMLSEINFKKWQSGQVTYLERVIECNLSKANRILSILSFHAHDLNMAKSNNYIKYKGKVLRYTKSGAKKSEELYARQFNINGKSVNSQSVVRPQ